MIKKTIQICLAVALLLIISGTTAAMTPVEEWNKTFGGIVFDYVHDVEQTSDRGYIMAGHTTSFDGSNTDAWLIKTYANGTEEWNRTFGNEPIDKAWSVHQTSDGGYIVAGDTGSFGEINGDAWLIKTYANGTEEWNRTFGGPGDDYALSVQETLDGGYIIAGNLFDNEEGAPDAWLIKTGENGIEEWNRTFGGGDYDSFSSVQQTTPDDGYIMAGSTRSLSIDGTQYAWLVKTYSNGTKEWNRTFGGTIDYDIGQSVKQTSDGGYIMVGEKDVMGADAGSAWLIKTYANGTEEWNRTFGGTGNDIAKSVQQTSDNGYIIAGDTSSFGMGSNDAWLIKTYSNGTEKWNMTFGGINIDSADSVQQTSDEGYIIAGETFSFGMGSNDAWLIKVAGTPVGEIEDTKEEIDSQDINNGIKVALKTKLDNAFKQLEKGDEDKAIKKLEDFISFVNKMEMAGKLSSSQADDLRDEAEIIIQLIQNSEG